MKILLDTHIFLWFISGDSRLSTDVRDVIRNPDNEIYLSVVSVWESIVKYQLGKLPLPESPETYLPKQSDRNVISCPVASVLHPGGAGLTTYFVVPQADW